MRLRCYEGERKRERVRDGGVEEEILGDFGFWQVLQNANE